MKLPDKENWLLTGHFDPRTPEQKQLDLEAKINDLTEKVLQMHALTEQLQEIINQQSAVLKANGLATSSVRGDN